MSTKKSIDEILEDIQFIKLIDKLVESGEKHELMKLMMSGGLERLLNLVKEEFTTKYRIGEVLATIPEPPTPKWEDRWEDGEDFEIFDVSDWERLGKEFYKTYKVTRIQPFTHNGKMYLRVYYAVKKRKRILANRSDITKWANSLTSEQKEFIIKLHNLTEERSFEREVWFNNGDVELTLAECYLKLLKKFSPMRYPSVHEVWEDEHDREPYPHWVR
jgi:hypothetical protein